MGIPTVSDDKAALRAFATQMRSDRSFTSHKLPTLRLASDPSPPMSPAKAGSIVESANIPPLSTAPPPPMPAVTLANPANVGPSLRGSQEQLEEARMMSKSFTRGNADRPTGTSRPQPRPSFSTMTAQSSGVITGQSYDLGAMGTPQNEHTLPRSVISPHRRAVAKAVQHVGDENQVLKRDFKHVPKGDEIKHKLKASSLQQPAGVHGCPPTNKSMVDTLGITPTITSSSRSSAPSVDGASASATTVNINSIQNEARTIAVGQVSNGHSDTTSSKQSQPACVTATRSGNTNEKMVTENFLDEGGVLEAFAKDSQNLTPAKLNLPDNIVPELIAIVQDQQQRLNKLEEERERRFFLGTKTPMEPFTVNVSCQNGFSGKVQAHSRMSGADLIRRIRSRAAVNQFETANILVRMDTEPLAHIAMIGEQGVTAGIKLSVTW